MFSKLDRALSLKDLTVVTVRGILPSYFRSVFVMLLDSCTSVSCVHCQFVSKAPRINKKRSTLFWTQGSAQFHREYIENDGDDWQHRRCRCVSLSDVGCQFQYRVQVSISCTSNFGSKRLITTKKRTASHFTIKITRMFAHARVYFSCSTVT